MGRDSKKNALGATRATIHDLQTFTEIQSYLKSSYLDGPESPEKLVDNWWWCCCPILNGATFLLNKNLLCSTDFDTALSFYKIVTDYIYNRFADRTGIQSRLAGEYGMDRNDNPIRSDEYYDSIFTSLEWCRGDTSTWEEGASVLSTEGLRTYDLYIWLTKNCNKFKIKGRWISISDLRSLYKALSAPQRNRFNETFQIGKQNGGWSFENRLDSYSAIRGVPPAILLVDNSGLYNHTLMPALSKALKQVKPKVEKAKLKTKICFSALEAKIQFPEWNCDFTIENGRSARRLCDLIENQLTSCSEQYALVIQQYLRSIDLQVEGFQLKQQIVNNLVAKYDIINNHISSRLLGKFLTRLLKVKEGKITPDQMVELLVSKDEAERKIGQTLSENS